MKKMETVGAGLALIILILLLYAIFIEVDRIEITDLYLNGTKDLKGITCLHITDLHMGKIGRREKKVLRLIEELKPDIIFLTGDYVKWNGDYEPALSFLSKLDAQLGVWAVMGDYDYSCSRKSCLFCHETGTGNPIKKNKVKFLKNEIIEFNYKGVNFCIVGIDKEAGESTILDDKLKPADESLTIILSHSPLMFDLIDEKSNVIVLAGDTHGGQIPVPGWVWKIAGYEKCAKYCQGIFKKGNKKMYVNRGIGTSHIPMRFLRRPEIAVLHF